MAFISRILNNLRLVIKNIFSVIREDGFTTLLKRGSSFLVEKVFWVDTYYLLERYMTAHAIDPEEYRPDIPSLTHAFIKSNKEADELVENGFLDFRFHFINAGERLEKGAIALCIYCDKEPAHIAWIATTRDAQKTFNNIPFRVDFARNEVCTGGALTLPAYRKKGIKNYASFTRDKYFRDNGIVATRSVVKASNIVSMRASGGYGTKIYGRARYTKILWWRHWKEIPLDSPVATVDGA